MMSEEILGIFPGVMRGKSTTGIKRLFVEAEALYCQLIFTTSRLIVARHKKSSLLSRVLYNPVYDFRQASTRERLKVKSVSAQSFLEADPENFEISNTDISVIECGAEDSFISLKVFTENLDSPKYHFLLSIREHYNESSDFREFLNAVLPGKV
jgi:hypothetical protein